MCWSFITGEGTQRNLPPVDWVVPKPTPPFSTRARTQPPVTAAKPGLRTMPEREIRMLRKATPKTRRPLRQTYQGRSARAAARPEGQAAPPQVFSRSDGHLPATGSADRRLRPEVCIYV